VSRPLALPRPATAPSSVGSHVSLLQTICSSLGRLKYVNSERELRAKIYEATGRPVEKLDVERVLDAVAERFAVDIHVWARVSGHASVCLNHVRVHQPKRPKNPSRPRVIDRPGSVERLDIVQHGVPATRWSDLGEVSRV
jgi:hypothetical protein